MTAPIRSRKTRHIGLAVDVVNAVKTGESYVALCGETRHASHDDYPMVGGRLCGTCATVYRNRVPGEPLPDESRTFEEIEAAATARSYTVKFQGISTWRYQP